MTADPYLKLRTPEPAAEEEICGCEPLEAVILCSRLTDNPFCCLACNGEVPPERIGFGAALAAEIAAWCTVSDALYRLWLDSGEYADWAAARLLDPAGQVNVEGLRIAAALHRFVPTCYRWFRNTEDEEGPAQCPVCAGPLEDSERKGDLVCRACRIVTQR